jgi:phosphate-selective porin
LLLAALAAAALVVPARAQQGGDVSVETALLDILREKGLINASEYDELMALARQRADANANETVLIEASLQRLAAPDVQVRGGTPTKLLFRSPDGKWSLGLRGELQARVETYNSDDDAQDDSNFSVPRARLTTEGTAGAPNVKYKLTIDASTTSKDVDPAVDTPASVRDAYIDWGFTRQDSFRMGQFKFPFGREMLMSTTQLNLVDISIAATEFSPNYEPGAMLQGYLGDQLLEYQLAAANGEGRGKNNTAGDDIDGLREGVRVVWNPLGPVKNEGPAFQTMPDDTTRASLGVAYMRNHDSSGLNTATVGADTTTRDIEASFYSGGFSLLAELYRRDGDTPTGSADDTGSTVQAGWFFLPETWEVVARYSDVDYQTKDDSEEHTIGLNYYVDKNNGKWQIDLSKLDNQGTTADATRVRLQYQVLF